LHDELKHNWFDYLFLILLMATVIYFYLFFIETKITQGKPWRYRH
jgi:hypothetical protein